MFSNENRMANNANNSKRRNYRKNVQDSSHSSEIFKINSHLPEKCVYDDDPPNYTYISLSGWLAGWLLLRWCPVAYEQLPQGGGVPGNAASHLGIWRIYRGALQNPLLILVLYRFRSFTPLHIIARHEEEDELKKLGGWGSIYWGFPRLLIESSPFRRQLEIVSNRRIFECQESYELHK